jgi:hypothetical protein
MALALAQPAMQLSLNPGVYGGYVQTHVLRRGGVPEGNSSSENPCANRSRRGAPPPRSARVAPATVSCRS